MGLRTLVLSLLISAGVVMTADDTSAQGGAKPNTPGPNYDSLAQIVKPVRNKDNKIVTLETTLGKMTLELWRDVAPAHADSFVALTKKGFYTNTIFHRVVKNFMIQGGDPTGKGIGGAGYNLNAEFSKEPHVEGTLSMARAQSVNSASSQFFICLAPASFLDGKYTVFGQLLKGYDALHRIGDTKVIADPNTAAMSRPAVDVKILKAYLSDAAGNPVK